MKLKSVVKIVAAGLPLLAVVGCGATNIAYKPMAASAAATKASVGLKIIDARPADKGGTEKNVVGQVRGSYGIPSSVKDASMDVAPSTIGAATTDALQQAGVGVGPSSKRFLVATIQHYWMDGLGGYKGTVTVQYDLQDASGKTVWSKQVSGASGGALIFTSAEKMTQEIFGKALTDLATKASAEFSSKEFQAALG